MKDKKFVIKIGDLIKEGGKKDDLKLKNKIDLEIDGLEKNGVSGNLILRSLNQDSLYVNLENITCKINDFCDRCQNQYTRDIEIPEYKARFVINEKIKQEEQKNSDDEIFLINAKDETIDIEPMILQAIKLEEPFVKRCPKCEKEINELSDNEEFEEGFIKGSNIVFH